MMFEPGSMVILTKATKGLLYDLPKDDQEAIKAIVGKPIVFLGICYGRAELEFTDSQGDNHTIWVELSLVEKA